MISESDNTLVRLINSVIDEAISHRASDIHIETEPAPHNVRVRLRIDGDLVLDDLKTDIVEVKLWGEASANAYPAIKEECYIEIVSYGGDTTGYQIPFNVHYTGVKTKGTFNISTKTFTAA